MTTNDEGIQAKLDAARRTLNVLRTDIQAFTETQLGKVLVMQTGEKSWSPKLTDKFDAPPIKWSILIGEIAYHLRSSLDHLVYKLVCENGRNPTKQNEFPIVWEIDKIIHKVIDSEKGSEYVKKGREYIDNKALKGVDEQQKAKILLNQGFIAHVGEYGSYNLNANPFEFSHLAYLCNVDKHRHLVSVEPKLVGLTDDYRVRQDETIKKGELPPRLCNTDFEIDVCFRFEQDDDRPSDLAGSVDDVLTDIILAVEHTIGYISGRYSRPFADLTNERKYQLRRRDKRMRIF